MGCLPPVLGRAQGRRLGRQDDDARVILLCLAAAVRPAARAPAYAAAGAGASRTPLAVAAAPRLAAPPAVQAATPAAAAAVSAGTTVAAVAAAVAPVGDPVRRVGRDCGCGGASHGRGAVARRAVRDDPGRGACRAATSGAARGYFQPKGESSLLARAEVPGNGSRAKLVAWRPNALGGRQLQVPLQRSDRRGRAARRRGRAAGLRVPRRVEAR
eukprot:scaffold33434_cov67-Isochrysis_galbana.AAC.2